MHTVTTAPFRVGDRVCRVFADRSDPANIGTVRYVRSHLVFVHWTAKPGGHPVHQSHLESAPLRTA